MLQIYDVLTRLWQPNDGYAHRDTHTIVHNYITDVYVILQYYFIKFLLYVPKANYHVHTCVRSC